MAEKAERVSEAPIAPNTPQSAAQAVAEHSAKPTDSPRAERMSYKVSELPNPINSHDQYVRAQLIEARLLRSAAERIAVALEELIERAESDKSAAKK